MGRYFLEVAYQGTAYSGFQTQKNSNTIQDELEKALAILYRERIELTGSSRTDAGVHALQNFFHFDFPNLIYKDRGILTLDQSVYKLNAMLPEDIVVKRIYEVKEEAHCRFDAISREYRYYIYQTKNPFKKDRAFYYPYPLQLELLQQAASMLMEYSNFQSFSKKHTQVKTFECSLTISEWERVEDGFVYHVKGNRFLRGMVRALTATMLQVGRGKLSMIEFRKVIESRDCSQADFSVPAHGLFLETVEMP